VLAALVAFAFAAEITRVIPSDSGFLLYAAGRVLDGARLYVDILEINPPLIIALNIPVVLAARALDLPEVLLYRLAVVVVLLACIGLTARALGYLIPADEAARRRWVVLLLALVLFPLAGPNFGQREQLLLALASPFLVLAAARAAGDSVPRWEAVAIGLLGGCAFALKPHFLLLWVAIEAHLMAQRRSWVPRVRPESLGAAGFLLAYGVIVLLVTPDYVRMVRLLGASYLRFLYDPFLHLLVTGPGVLLSFFAVLAWIALSRRVRHPALCQILAIALVGSLIAAAAQQKGLRYHFYPTFGIGVVLIGVVAADSWGVLKGPAERLYHVLASAVLATVTLMTLIESGLQLAGRGERRGGPELPSLSRLVSDKAAGQPVFVMSYHIGSAFPLINYSGAVLGSRFHHLWILAADYLDLLKSPEPLRYREPAAMPPSERFLNDAVLADLQRYRPKLLIVLRHARDDPSNGYRRLDYIRYFGRDARFAAIFEQYQELDVVGNYVVYERVGTAAPRTGPQPTSAPGKQDLRRRRADVLGIGLRSPRFLLRLGIFVLIVAGLTAQQLAGRSAASKHS
jgi:hypothetical protein